MISEKRINKIKHVVENRQNGLVVVLGDIHDPHNAAAIFRTCDGFGIQKAYLIFEKEERFNPKKIGKMSSSTANKWLDFETFKSTTECLNKLKQDGFKIVATALTEKAVNIFETDLKDEKLALLIGNEHTGLSEQALKLSDKILIIPMQGMVQSLNVSVTAGIIIYEIARQRQSSKGNYQMSEEEQGILKERFSEK